MNFWGDALDVIDGDITASSDCTISHSRNNIPFSIDLDVAVAIDVRFAHDLPNAEPLTDLWAMLE